MNAPLSYVKSSGRAPDRPRLSPHAQILPVASGWLVRRRRDIVPVPSPLPAALNGPLLDQLDGSRDLAALASGHALALEDMSALIERMAQLDLFEAAHAMPAKPADIPARIPPNDESAITVPLEVLIVGLGELGLRVAEKLSGFDGTRLVLFDPAREREIRAGVGVRRPAIDDDATVQGWRRLLERRGHTLRVVSAEALSCEELHAALRPVLAGVQAVICCADQPSALTGALAAFCRDCQMPMVIGQLTDDGARVGPALVVGAATPALGCPVCAECHEADRDPFAAAMPPYLATRWPRPAPWRYPHRPSDVAVIAKLVVLSLCTTLEIVRGARPVDSQATRVDFRSRTARVDSVAKHPACRVCFPPPGPNAAPALHRWQPALEPAHGPATVLREQLPRLQALAGANYGLFDVAQPPPPRERHAVWQFFRDRGVDPRANLLANAHSFRAVRRETTGAKVARHVAEGFDLQDPEQAEALALVEGLERLCALSFCPSERLVQARYVDISTEALDPRSLPLYADEQYAEPGFPLQRFDPEARIAWVWGVDISAAGSPVLVPADFVFRSRSTAPIFRANSNGAACHSSWRQAVINGIYEIVERDALMIAWLNRLSLPRVALDSSDADPWSLRRTFNELDLELAHVDITTDLAIPVLLSVLRDRRNSGLLLLNMVSHLHAQTQLAKLHRELAQFLFPYLADRDHFINDCTHDPDPNSVVTFPDHLGFYQAEDRNRLAAFLTGAVITRRFGEGSYLSEALTSPDEQEWLVRRLSARGHRTIVVDCTLPLLHELGLHAVKVLIPGLQPLNCGHRLRPLGGERVLTVAQRMGLAAGRRRIADLNPWPHPFW